jgi:FAD/FMN-containing dehydrogenase
VRACLDALAPDARVVCFGHLGDGNLHVNIVGPPRDDFEVDDAVLTLVAAMGGSISAEHGIGIAKRAALERSASSADIAAMRAIKRALDPRGILNPGVLVASRL